MPSSDKVAIRALGAGCALVIAALVAARFVAIGVQTKVPFRVFASQSAFFNRTREMMPQLPALAASTAPTAIMIGSSTVMFNFAPRFFDVRMKERGHEITSYNLGIMSIVPDLLLSVSKRMHDDFDAQHRRIAVSIIEFTPQATTKKFQGKRSIVMKRALVIRPEELYVQARSSPAVALELLQMKIFGGIGPKEVTSLVRAWWFDSVPTWWHGTHEGEWHDPEDLASEALQNKLNDIHGGSYPGWDTALRGEFRRLFPESRDEYAAVLKIAQSDEAMKHWRDFFIRTGDINDLNFDEDQVQDFIAAVKEFQSFSDKTYLMLAPRNLKWHEPSAEGRAHLKDVLERIHRETGIELIDYFTDPSEFSISDFYDNIHLAESAKEKFSVSIADRVSTLLSGSAH